VLVIPIANLDEPLVQGRKAVGPANFETPIRSSLAAGRGADTQATPARVEITPRSHVAALAFLITVAPFLSAWVVATAGVSNRSVKALRP
jgi:hypothetical protein